MTGRVNQRLRTHNAIVQAAVEVIRTGGEVTMPEVARTALVSEATAYRYFPDLASLIHEALGAELFTPAEALISVARSTDPAQRIAVATEHLLRHVWRYQGAVRAMIAATITRPDGQLTRPGLRLGLIEKALEPMADRPELPQLKRALTVVVSAEALFALTDLGGLSPDDAIASLVHTATVLTEAFLRLP
jgi:AcrR family transcriptional regulator